MSSRQTDLATIIGARPQFVKCALVTPALREADLNEFLIHTGQHYDDSLSGTFFRDLDIPHPNVNLGVGSGTHAEQTAAAPVGIEAVLLEQRPRLVLVYGDTNSTLAGALASVKLGIPVAHVEAGLRSYNRTMPEEFNRIAADHWSELLFCHNERTRDCLLSEKVQGKIHVVGDVMREVLDRFAPRAFEQSPIPRRLGLEESGYAVLTVHRPVNSDPVALREILGWCLDADVPTVFPTHPRVQNMVADLLSEQDPRSERVRQIAPLSYSDMISLVGRSRLVLTDSGGLQKEAFFLGVPCITLRAETEWIETLDANANVLAGDRPLAKDLDRAYGTIRDRAAATRVSPSEQQSLLNRVFGPPDAAWRIAHTVAEYLRGN